MVDLEEKKRQIISEIQQVEDKAAYLKGERKNYTRDDIDKLLSNKLSKKYKR
ncbi:MAG: hypothetical protein M9887_08510 [Chitinophagales bacterium]|nr:hypothetical protein [Chitinophagales bacterium]